MLNEEDVRRAIPRLQEIPFDSDRKLMSVKCKLHDKETVLTKGALDVLLNRCIKIRKNNLICISLFIGKIVNANHISNFRTR